MRAGFRYWMSCMSRARHPSPGVDLRRFVLVQRILSWRSCSWSPRATPWWRGSSARAPILVSGSGTLRRTDDSIGCGVYFFGITGDRMNSWGLEDAHRRVHQLGLDQPRWPPARVRHRECHRPQAWRWQTVSLDLARQGESASQQKSASPVRSRGTSGRGAEAASGKLGGD
jgi:hypothetical protein